MRLDADEIAAIADQLAPRVADILERRLAERPEWAMSIGEAAAWACLREDTIRNAIASGRLPSVKVGRQVRIRRADLFRLRGDSGNGEQPEGTP